MRVSKYLLFKGAVYRLAALPMPRDISWGPDEWPSEDYIVSMQLRPPMSKEEYYDIKRQIDALEETALRSPSTEDRQVAEREALDLARLILPVKRWLHENNPGAERMYRRRWMQGKAEKTAAPELGPEYNIKVDAADLDPEVLSWFTGGQGDPLYALASRLTAYGETLASEEELEALINSFERMAQYVDKPEERIRMDDVLYEAYRLLGKA